MRSHSNRRNERGTRLELQFGDGATTEHLRTQHGRNSTLSKRSVKSVATASPQRTAGVGKGIRAMYSYDVFISYNAAQVQWVRNLVKRLKGLGIQPFFDRDIDLAGSRLDDAIILGMMNSRCCVVVLTPKSVKSGWVGYEIERARKLDPDAERRFLIPLLLKDCQLPPNINGLGYIDCRTGLTKQKLSELVRAIAHRGAAEFVGSAPPDDVWRWCYSHGKTDVFDLEFLDKFRGVLVGDEGTILRTVDGGRTWNKLKSNTSEGLYSVVFHADGKSGRIVGSRGTSLRTDDAGESWKLVATRVDDDLSDVAWCEGNTCACAVGSQGVVLRCKKSSASWDCVRIPGRPALWGIRFASDGLFGCAVGANGTVLLSNDAGRHWKPKVVSIRSKPIRSNLYTVSILPDGKTICIVGDEGRILMSPDRGQSWVDRSQRMKLFNNWLNTVDFSNNGQLGWVVGTKGSMLKTTNGGNTWAPFVLDGYPELIAVRCLADGTVWVGGVDGALLTTRPV